MTTTIQLIPANPWEITYQQDIETMRSKMKELHGWTDANWDASCRMSESVILRLGFASPVEVRRIANKYCKKVVRT